MKNDIRDGEVWELTDKDEHSQNYGRQFRFDFSYITSKSMKEVLQGYVRQRHQTQSITLYKLYCELGKFNHFHKFAVRHGVTSFKTLNNDDICFFIAYLRTEISAATKKPLAYAYQKTCLDVVKNLIRWGQIHMPDHVPENEIFIGNEYHGTNSKLHIDFIPDKIMAQIAAALPAEPNLYVRYGIIILQSTAIRIEDMLQLKTGCLQPHPINGYTLVWYDHKNRKERPPLPIPNECAIAIEHLMEYSKMLREQAADGMREFMFLKQRKGGLRKGETILLRQSEYRKLLSDFVARHNILDEDGTPFRLTPLKFRRTLATDMLSKGTNIKVIQEMLGHTAPSTTKMHYADVKDRERAEQFQAIGIIGDVNQVDRSVIPDEAELRWFQENQDGCAKMCDGYCTKPFQSETVCDRLLRRQKCYTCSRYITTPEYLEYHKAYLRSLEQQLEDNPYGHHYAEHFLGTVRALKEIIRRLEGMQNA